MTGCDTAAEMAVHLLERYPESDVLKAIRTLARALGDDLRSKLASSQPGKLEATLKDLKSIQTITSTLSAAEKALRSVAAKGGAIKRSSVRVATDLIRLAHLNPAERFITDVLLGHVDGESPSSWVICHLAERFLPMHSRRPCGSRRTARSAG